MPRPGSELYKAAFDAKELGERYHLPDGTLVHAELLIGDSVVMVKDAQDDEFRALLCTYWPDVDAAWDRAVRAGAEIVYPLADQFYGERGGRLADPFGNQLDAGRPNRDHHAGRGRRASIGVEPDPPSPHDGHRGGWGAAPALRGRCTAGALRSVARSSCAGAPFGLRPAAACDYLLDGR